MFSLEYSNKALKFLKNLDNITAGRILKKVEELQLEPITRDTKKLEGQKEKFYRIRIGDYRIVYEVDYIEGKIGIVDIDKRSRVYK